MAIGASIVIFIIVIFGIVLCIIPGIYFANTLSLAFIILIFEKKGLGNAFMRSALLVKSDWWNTFLINLIGLILLGTISFIISIPSMLTGFSAGILSQGETPMEYPDWYWILIGFSTVVSSLLWIIPYTFLAFQYFNLEERTKMIRPNENRLD